MYGHSPSRKRAMPRGLTILCYSGSVLRSILREAKRLRGSIEELVFSHAADVLLCNHWLDKSVYGVLGAAELCCNFETIAGFEQVKDCSPALPFNFTIRGKSWLF